MRRRAEGSERVRGALGLVLPAPRAARVARAREESLSLGSKEAASVQVDRWY